MTYIIKEWNKLAAMAVAVAFEMIIRHSSADGHTCA
jgi:hypothetical protein